jgi:valyl-tRNA synthetase
MTSQELAKAYEPADHESAISKRWVDAKAFSATADDRESYVIMMPLPNVTGALHMGHAMDNVMQDMLIRWHRMRGHNTLWQPGTDHAGIATQALVEKRLKEFEGKTRHDVGREGLLERIWSWKEICQKRIISQQQSMGCSCDWDRQRFTMDEVCSASVREAFFKLFRDKLIYRGDRLVNWDCFLQTAIANDEVVHKKVNGHFWHLRYPIIDPQPGEPEYVIVATTRPETMLGDTAVACHPNPARALEKKINEAKEKLANASPKEKGPAEKELARLEARKESHLPQLIKLTEMAAAGRKVRLPLLDREIPLITDMWAKPELGSGCVKITPAHDPNDYEVWTRHKDDIESINVLNPDGTLNENAGPYAGIDRFKARKKVVADFDAQGLLDKVEDREVEIGHSDRSKTPVEPYLCKQWWVRMSDVEGGIVCGKGTKKEFVSPGLAQAAIDAANGDWRSATGLKVDFHPDSDRYRSGYTAWLAEKRDWCISRQLWWGHRIAVWWAAFADASELEAAAGKLPADGDGSQTWISDVAGTQYAVAEGLAAAKAHPELGPFELQVCLRSESDDAGLGAQLEALGLARDPDVLDTWFSSALWPFSTLGWPNPAGAPILEGQPSLDGSLDTYYPGSCLVTGRDILTLWVARMVLMGLYCMGDVPFTDVFLHAKIMDGKGEGMSKSKGNGVDPKDIIARYGTDAMRYVICGMQTGMQDVRLPVKAVCPHCEKTLDLAKTKHGATMFTYLCGKCGEEFDVLGTMENLKKATPFSDRFDEGKNFCNKVWNGVRFALMNLGELSYAPLSHSDLASEDRWILSRLSRAVASVDSQLNDYNPSAAVTAARDFFWGELCDWYLELIKPRMKEDADAASGQAARQVLATTLDQALRLLHPFVPFLTETLWGPLGAQAPTRGVESELPSSELCLTAAWPTATPAWEDDAVEAEYQTLRDVIRKIRDVRQQYNVPPKKALPCAIKGSGASLKILEGLASHVSNLTNLSSLEFGADPARPENSGTAVVGDLEIFVGDVLDPAKERARLEKEKAKLEKQIGGVEKKLSNEKFVANAPDAVVAKERERLEGLRAQLVLFEENLSELG